MHKAPCPSAFQQARETHQSRALLVTATRISHRTGIAQRAAKPPASHASGTQELTPQAVHFGELWSFFFFQSPASSQGPVPLSVSACLCFCRCVFRLLLSTAPHPSGLSASEHSPSFKLPGPGAHTFLLRIYRWGHSHLVNQQSDGRWVGFPGSPSKGS